MKEKKKNIFERVALSRLQKHEKSKNFEDQDLDDVELLTLKKVHRNTIVWAAIIGACGVLFYYVPVYFSDFIANDMVLKFSIFDKPISLAIPPLVLGFILMFIEIVSLFHLNIRALEKMTVVTNFPNVVDPHYEVHMSALISIGVEKPRKNEFLIGLNPYEGYSKVWIFSLFLFNKMKAAVSNMIFKQLIRKLLGRYAIRIIVDLAGMPIFAFWNAYASHKILKQSKLRMLAPKIINYTTSVLKSKHSEKEEFKAILYDLLQYLAIKKRGYNENHYLLSLSLLSAFEIPTKTEHRLDPLFNDKFTSLDEELRRDISKLLVVGMMLDGGVSKSEKIELIEMHEKGLIDVDIKTVKKMIKMFQNGQGIQCIKTELKLV